MFILQDGGALAYGTQPKSPRSALHTLLGFFGIPASSYRILGGSTGETGGEVGRVPTKGILQFSNAQGLHSPRQQHWSSSELPRPHGSCGLGDLDTNLKSHVNILTSPLLVITQFISTDPTSSATRLGYVHWGPPGEALGKNISNPLKRFFFPCVLQSHNNVSLRAKSCVTCSYVNVE